MMHSLTELYYFTSKYTKLALQSTKYLVQIHVVPSYKGKEKNLDVCWSTSSLYRVALKKS